MFSELRFVLRTLARSRGFTAITVLTLALGIGSAGSIFSVADWALFRANKFPDDVFVIGGQSTEQAFFNPFRPGFIVEAYEQRTDVFAEFAKGRQQQGNIVVEGRPVGTVWTELSANAMAMFGTRLQLGRFFLPGEDIAGSDQVVILSDWFWRQTFMGDENILGRRIIVGDAICTVVGVLAEGQSLPGYLGGPLARPLVYKNDPAEPWRSGVHFFGRLRSGVAREQALAALQATHFTEPPQFKGAFTQREHVALAGLGETHKGSWMTTYWLMLGAVAFLYAIACLNASNLMLVRMLGQRRDLCVRLAMGASRWRVIRLLVLESAVLAVGGGLLGVLVTNWLFPLLLSATGNQGMGLHGWASWRVGWRVVGVLATLSVLTSAFIALLPALRVLRTDINSGLKEGGGALGESPGLARLRGGLVVLQVAFAVILLAGAGLMIRSFQQFQKVDFGFEPAGLHKVMLQFPDDAPRDWQPRLLKLREIEAILREIPGVRSAGFGTDALLPGYRYSASKFPGPGGKEVGATIGGFDPGFREAVGLKLKAGHWFTLERGEEVVVNESFARAMWPDEDPIGKILLPVGIKGNKDWIGWTVIGVVGDLRATMREGPGNHLYRAEGMEPQQFNTFIVRTAQARDPAAMEAMRRRVYTYDHRIIIHQISTLTELRDQQLGLERMANSVLQVLAGIALLLTLIGIFSVLAYTVDRRLGEFGVRLALGASASDLVQLVARRGLALALIGVALGLGGALGVTRFLRTLLFETTANDPWVLGGVATLLLLAALLACLVPARRAARVDVAKLLRSE